MMGMENLEILMWYERRRTRSVTLFTGPSQFSTCSKAIMRIMNHP